MKSNPIFLSIFFFLLQWGVAFGEAGSALGKAIDCSPNAVNHEVINGAKPVDHIYGLVRAEYCASIGKADPNYIALRRLEVGGKGPIAYPDALSKEGNEAAQRGGDGSVGSLIWSEPKNPTKIELELGFSAENPGK